MMDITDLGEARSQAEPGIENVCFANFISGHVFSIGRFIDSAFLCVFAPLRLKSKVRRAIWPFFQRRGAKTQRNAEREKKEVRCRYPMQLAEVITI